MFKILDYVVNVSILPTFTMFVISIQLTLKEAGGIKVSHLPNALLNLAPPSGYALNLEALIKVSKVSSTSQLSYEILKSSFERKFR